MKHDDLESFGVAIDVAFRKLKAGGNRENVLILAAVSFRTNIEKIIELVSKTKRQALPKLISTLGDNALEILIIPDQSRKITAEISRTIAFISGHSNKMFVARATNEDYLKRLKRVINAFANEIKLAEQSDDPIISELLKCIENCVSSFTLGSPRVCILENSIFQTLANHLLNFIKKFENASANMAMIFRLVCFILPHLILQDRGKVFELASDLIAIIPAFRLNNYTLLRDAVLVFLVMIPDCIDSFFELDISLEKFLKDIVSVINSFDALVIRSKGSDFSLDISVFGFYDEGIFHDNNTFHWFKLQYIFLDHSKDQDFYTSQVGWLAKLSMIKLLMVYYKAKEFNNITYSEKQLQLRNALEDEDDPDSSSNSIRVSKKRKIVLSIVSQKNGTWVSKNNPFFSLAEIITESSSVPEWLNLLYDSGFEAVACQFLMMYLSLDKNVNEDKLISFKSTLLKSLDGADAQWCCLSLKIILDHSPNIFTLDELIYLLKICFQRVSKQEYVYCATATALMSYLDSNDLLRLHLVGDVSVTRIVTSLVELADVDGPAEISCHSIIFWLRLAKTFRSLQFESFSSNLIKWVLSKFDDSPCVILGLFLAWVCGDKVIEIHADQLYGKGGSFYDYNQYGRMFMDHFIIWRESQDLISSLILSSSQLEKNESIFISPSIKVSSKIDSEINGIVLALFSELDALSTEYNKNNPKTMKKASNAMILLGLRLIDFYLLKDHDSVFAPYIMNLEYRLQTIFETHLLDVSHNILVDNLALVNDYFFQNCADINGKQKLLSKYVRPDRIVSYVLDNNDDGNDKTSLQGVSMKNGNTSFFDDDFGQIKKRGLHHAEDKLGNFSIAKAYHQKSICQQTLLLCTTPLDAIEFLSKLKPNQIIQCCHESYSILEKATPNVAKKALRLIGEKILLGCDLYSEIVICHACKLLGLFTDNLELYGSDYTDVLKYLILLKRGKRGLMTTMYAAVEFQNLMLLFLAKVSKLTLETAQQISKDLGLLGVEDFDSFLTISIDPECNSLRLLLASSYADYFKNVSGGNIKKSYAQVYRVFQDPQTTNELFFAFSNFLMICTQYSNYTTILYLFNLCEFHDVPKASSIITKCFSITGEKVGTKRLLQHFFLELLGLWHRSSLLLDFPFNLFGYKTQSEFIIENYKILFIVCFAYKDQSATELTISKITHFVNKTKSQLAFELFPQIIALAFTHSGKRVQIGSSLKSTGVGISAYSEWLLYSIWEIIRLTDVSSNKWIQLIDNDTKIKGFDVEGPLIYISFVTSKNLIQELIQKHGSSSAEDNNNFFNTQKIYFLASRAIWDLECAETITEKQLCIRRLIFIVSFTNEPAIFNIRLVDLFLSILENPDISNIAEFENLILRVLNFSAKNSELISSLSLPGFAMKIGIYLVKCISSKKKISKELLAWTETFINDSIEGQIIKYYCWQIKGKTSLLESEDVKIDYIIKNIIKSDKYKNNSCYIDFLSEYFKNKSSILSFNLKIDKNIAKFLYNLSSLNNENISEGFLNWKAVYLGKFYAETGYEFLPEKPRTELRWVQESFSKGACRYIMAMIFRDFRKWYNNTLIKRPSKERLAAESVLGCLIMEHRLHKELFEDFDRFEKSFADELLYICEMESNVIKYVYSFEKPFNNDLAEFVENKENIKLFQLDFDTWATHLMFVIIYELQEPYTYLKPFEILVGNIPNISKIFLANLIIFLIDALPKSRVKLIGKLLTIYLGKDIISCSIEAKQFLIDLGLRLRIGIRYDPKKFVYSIGPETYRSLFSHCCELKFWKMALLFYELDKDNLSDPRLEEVYRGIGVDDIKHLLPAKPTLLYAASDLSETFSRSKALVATNAMFEVGGNGISLSLPNSIVQAMEQAGLPAISHLVAAHFGEKYTHSNTYRWAWKLGRWEVPNADSDSYDLLVFSTLKLLRTGNKKFENTYLRALRIGLKLGDSKLIEQEANCGNNDKMKLLGLLWGIQNSRKNMLMWHDWYTDRLFNEYEDILLSRQVSLEVLNSQVAHGSDAHIIRKLEYNLARVVELQRYGNFAISNKENQKAMNAAMKIEFVVSGINNNLGTFKESNDATQIVKDIQAISQYSIATTLWNQNDTSIALQILRKLIDELDDNKEYNRLVTRRRIVDKVLLKAIMVRWLHILKQETAASIVEQYIEKPINSTSSLHAALMYHTFAEFCDTQLKEGSQFENIARLKKLRDDKYRDYCALPKENRTDEVRIYANRLKKQIEMDKNLITALQNSKDKFIRLAIRYYLKSILCGDHEHVDSDVNRFCALWLRYSNNKGAIQEVSAFLEGQVPYDKFLGWISQLSSKLAIKKESPRSSLMGGRALLGGNSSPSPSPRPNNDFEFQDQLRRFMINASLKHPYHTLFIIKSLRLQRLYLMNKRPDPVLVSRISAADEIWEILRNGNSNSNFSENILKPIDLFCDYSMELANYPAPKAQRRFSMGKTMRTFWVDGLQVMKIPLPTARFLDDDGSFIQSIDTTVEISLSGLTRPKIVKFKLANGEYSKVLFKGNTDDLRQDAIMEQVFEQVNVMLLKDKKAKRRNLNMRTYRVVPLGQRAGLIEFVPNSISLLDSIKEFHKMDEISSIEALKRMQENEESTEENRIKVFKQICNKIKPVLSKFFFETFMNPYEWFDSKLNYTRGTATCLIVGHVVGLGDRHCNNILLDRITGEPVHIDLGVAFDQGKLLKFPEIIPFRLTRDIVDGFGVCGVEGVFRKSCENVFRVLREKRGQLDGVLEVLKWDPLYIWTISKLRKEKLKEQDLLEQGETEGFEADRAVAAVQAKLGGLDSLSVEAAVQGLIREATDPARLALIFRGWAPYY